MENLLDIVSPHQREVLKKLLCRSEDSQIYLCGYEDSDKKNARGVAKIAGAYNASKKKREYYQVTFYKSNSKSSFWCDCPYQKFKSGKENTVCKHICFLVCKVLARNSSSFFESKKLDEDSMLALIEKVKCSRWIAAKPSYNGFDASAKPIDDVCPICYDDMEPISVASCPDCYNHVHKDCIAVWLEKQVTCVYCRSDVWKAYRA